MNFWVGLAVFVLALMCLAQTDPKVRRWEVGKMRSAWDQLGAVFGRKQAPAEPEAEAVAPVQEAPDAVASAAPASPVCPATSANSDQDVDDLTSAWRGPGFYCVDGIAPGPAYIYALERRTLDAAGGTVLGGPFASEAGARVCAQRTQEKDAAGVP
jgi:hypothetical protein